jgi:site-specific DNA-cytosine methylase
MKHGVIIPLIGGMAIGAHRALEEAPSWAISWNDFKTNEENFKQYYNGVPFRTLDNENIDNLSLKDDLFKNTMIVSAVPPCAGLSRLNPTIGNHTANEENDYSSNKWMYLASSLILRDIRPKVMIFENAPGLMQNFGRWVREQAINIGKKYGYSTSFVYTGSTLHGLPQNRKRSFAFFWDSEYAPNFNWYNRTHKTPKDYLESEFANYSSTIENSLSIMKEQLKDNIYYKYYLEKYGSNWRDVMSSKSKKQKIVSLEYYLFEIGLQDDFIEFYKDKKEYEKEVKHIEWAKYKISIGKGWWNSSPHFYRNGEAYNAITMRAPNMIHPSEDRYLTLREHMYLMGLPHEFKLQNEYYNAVFQNVPVNTATDWTSFARDYVEGKTTSSGSQVIYGDNFKQKQWT